MFMEKAALGKFDGIPAHVLQHFKKQRQSGVSIQAYCKRSGISTWTFYNWRKLYKEPAPSSSTTQTALPISFSSIGPLSIRAGLCDIRFPDGITVTVHQNTPAETLVRIIRGIAERKTTC
jgi:hypothetical protein